MEIPQKAYVEQEQIGMLEEISSTISEKNLSLVLDNVTKNLYSDPIGAFVRELTSNGVDANKRNSTSEKIKVRIYREGDIAYFEVKDEGNGMTPKVFKEVYMSWFESDKRNDAGQIGGWGIGSKSPLAYAESYEISTIAEGMRYDYEVVRQAPAPKATLLTSYATNKKSGTTVRVEIEPGDEFKVHQACVRQLVYFDNVVVTNEIYYYDNHFKIIEHDEFVVRSDAKYPFGNEMHIVIGQVAYPIDWLQLGKDTDSGKRIPLKEILVPVGIKFNINDLEVNLNRETIRYTDEVKIKILQRITTVKEILKQLYISRLSIDTLPKYIETVSNPKRFIDFAGYQIYFGIDMKSHKFTFRSNGYDFSFDPKEALMYAFEGIDLSKREGNNSWGLSLKEIRGWKEDYVYSVEGQLEHWASLYRREKKYIRRIPLTRSIIYKYAGALGLVIEQARFGKFKKTLQTGAIKKVFAFVKMLEHFLVTNLEGYDVVPEAFIEREKAKQEALKEERKGNITYYDENGTKTVATLQSLIENYQYVFYVSRDASKEEQIAYMTMYRSFAEVYTKTKYSTNINRNPTKYPRILVGVFSASVIAKLRNKTKELTINQRILFNGKKQWVSTTKTVNAFLSADKLFKFRELFSQLHVLRYTTLIHAKRLPYLRLRLISYYYAELLAKIPITNTYKAPFGNNYIYPYIFFRKQIDAITGNINPAHEAKFNELMAIADKLNILDSFVDEQNGQLAIKEFLRTNKITKLNPIYYGY